MHVDNAPQFFGALATRGRELNLGKATGTWQFDVEGAGTWTVKADQGSLTVANGASENPTAQLFMSEAELLRLADVETHENPLTGLLRGAIHLKGDLAFAQRLLAIMPLPDDTKPETKEAR
jgi:predicted secreted protein